MAVAAVVVAAITAAVAEVAITVVAATMVVAVVAVSAGLTETTKPIRLARSRAIGPSLHAHA
jgi:hypothetical protein